MNPSNLPKILFLDIETVSAYPTYEEMSPEWQLLWARKARFWTKDSVDDQLEEANSTFYLDKAGIFAEFGKVVCISMGLITLENGKISALRLRSIYGEDEKKVLLEFAELLNTYFPNPDKFYLCGHNIKEFDVPFLARRMIVQGISLPAMMDIGGKKPWETKFILDTLEFWKFGDYKHYTSLRLLAHILGIPSPKDDIDGSEVGYVYWVEQDLERIKLYCEKDVKTTVQVFLRLNGMDALPDE
jgi:predicted PolB exonuclease-like 3'-5' exonuclease